MRKYLMFAAISIASLFLLGCLDIPNEPQLQKSIKSFTIYAVQKNQKDSSLLKINPNDSATLFVKIEPEISLKNLRYRWLNENKKLDENYFFEIPANTPIKNIPHSLEIFDAEDNVLKKDFQIIINTPPEFSSNAFPPDKHQFFGSSKKAFDFFWEAKDSDENDNLNYTLLLDDNSFNVGSLTNVKQSGFKPGWHRFSVIATDSYGDADTLDTREFQVIEQLGDNL